MTILDEDAIMTDNNDSAPHEPAQEKRYLVALTLVELAWVKQCAEKEALACERAATNPLTRVRKQEAAYVRSAMAWRRVEHRFQVRIERALRGHEEIE